MNRENRDIGDYFKERFQDYREAAPENLWDRISTNIDVQAYNRKRLVRKRSLYGLGTAGIVIIAALSVLISNYRRNSGDELFENYQKEIPESVATLPNDSVRPSFDREKSPTSPKEPDSPAMASGKEEYFPGSGPVPSRTEITEVTRNEATPADDTLFISDVSRNKVPAFIQQPLQMEHSLERLESYELEELLKVMEEDTQRNHNEALPPLQDQANKLHIPKAFTPNNDGLNDRFHIVPPEEVSDFKMNIYDRNGRLLFYTQDINQGWDGRLNGELLPTSSYLYVIHYKDISGKYHSEKGFVILVR